MTSPSPTSTRCWSPTPPASWPADRRTVIPGLPGHRAAVPGAYGCGMPVPEDPPGPPGARDEQSALLIRVPAAEPAVGAHRARLDASARDGVPAHLTVLYPFLPPAQIDDA